MRIQQLFAHSQELGANIAVYLCPQDIAALRLSGKVLWRSLAFTDERAFAAMAVTSNSPDWDWSFAGFHLYAAVLERTGFNNDLFSALQLGPIVQHRDRKFGKLAHAIAFSANNSVIDWTANNHAALRWLIQMGYERHACELVAIVSNSTDETYLQTLVPCATYGRLEVLRALLHQNSAHFIPRGALQLCLTSAAHNGHSEVVATLLFCGFVSPDADAYLGFLYACKLGHMSVVNVYLSTLGFGQFKAKRTRTEWRESFKELLRLLGRSNVPAAVMTVVAHGIFLANDAGMEEMEELLVAYLKGVRGKRLILRRRRWMRRKHQQRNARLGNS
ncbi:hypothetical protein BJ741DRAFT_602573 [Chytriomyces cf. hyalinus JEL632]|nr:hypothetical protein BJ741DRAFT_602573 [Chytriomyces cf. hyalinus JEL632]